ncbi:MAG: hypothetical protein AABW79_04075 [Nanoarchaeota archaeon]
MKIEVSIEKRYAFLIVGALLLISGAIFVYSLTPGTAPNPGHTLDNVAPPSPCATGEFLSWTGSAWDCVIPSATVTSVGELNCAVPSGGTSASCTIPGVKTFCAITQINDLHCSTGFRCEVFGNPGTSTWYVNVERGSTSNCPGFGGGQPSCQVRCIS